ncbi:MAG TPA: neutral/alkaline non-lysosomal ceramidase N-terminal domain-containing protein [Terriglobia bacterium]|nr:neutral/alkaline non-lysosomal ceramidase N-terminal domain-containing protein [Terriglobia bacterium]
MKGKVMMGERRWFLCRDFLLSALVLLLFCPPGKAAVMKAGVARVDITPPAGVQMWGYFNRLKGAEGVIDPLYARVLVLEAGEQRLAYVDLDLGRTFGPASIERLREAANQSSGISSLIVQATHTHAGPVVMDVYPSGTPAWETAALEKIGQAIHDAHDHAVPVRLGTGYGKAYIGYNRRRLNPDGTVTMVWNNSARVPTWPVDPTISVLRIDYMDGQPLAVLVNYACHPVTFGSDNMRFSADFPGVMCKTVEKAFGGKPLVFFMQGAPGDINVYDAGTPVTEDVIGRRDWAGETLGKAAAEVAQKIQTAADPDASIDFAEDPLPIRLRWEKEKFREEVVHEISPEAFKIYAPPIEETLHLPVTTVLIDRKIAMMGVPGEPFVEFQMNWRQRCRLHDCFFLGYANGYAGYFPTIQAAVEGGYGAANATTWAEVGAGERMVDHAVVTLYKMLGWVKDAPKEDWK